jgi:energy-coupling factor transporter ATP-binding protein EcfA2
MNTEVKNIKLAPGVATVIVGPQGCGKTELARELAEAYGPFAEIEVRELDDKFQHWMRRGLKTVVVEGFPTHKGTLDRLKTWITSPEMSVNRKGQSLVAMPTPNFVFTTGDADVLTRLAGARRFNVVDLG